MKIGDNFVRYVKPGHKVKMTSNLDYDGKEQVLKEFKVIAVYPFHVVAVDKLGIRRSICYGDLIRAGYEKQLLKYEALKHEPPVHPQTGIQVIDKKGKKRGRKRRLL